MNIMDIMRNTSVMVSAGKQAPSPPLDPLEERAGERRPLVSECYFPPSLTD